MLRKKLRILVAVSAMAVCGIAAGAAAPPANAYYEQKFCVWEALHPDGLGFCVAREYHHLAKVSANISHPSGHVCAASTNSSASALNSDVVCGWGYVTKYLNGHAGRGLCSNPNGYWIRMDYCVQKF